MATPKRALDEPEGTETVGGTVRTRGSLLCRATGVSAGAGTSRDTRFELKLLGPVKHCLSSATDLTLGSLTTLSWVLALPAPIEAVRVAVTEAPAVVSTVKVGAGLAGGDHDAGGHGRAPRLIALQGDRLPAGRGGSWSIVTCPVVGVAREDRVIRDTDDAHLAGGGGGGG